MGEWGDPFIFWHDRPESVVALHMHLMDHQMVWLEPCFLNKLFYKFVFKILGAWDRCLPDLSTLLSRLVQKWQVSAVDANFRRSLAFREFLFLSILHLQYALIDEALKFLFLSVFHLQNASIDKALRFLLLSILYLQYALMDKALCFSIIMRSDFGALFELHSTFLY